MKKKQQKISYQEILKNAISDYSYEYCNNLPSEKELEKTHVFSNNFKLSMQKLIIKQSRPTYYVFNTIGKKVAVILITILVVASTTAFSVKAIREPIINFFIEIFSDHCEVSFDKHSGLTDQTNIETDIVNEFFPTVIPEGYKVSDGNNYKGHKEYVFKNDKGSEIVYSQDLLISKTAISADEADIEEIKINGYDAFYVHGSDEDKINTVIWRNEFNSLCLYGNADKETLLKLANSTKLK